MLVQLTPGRKGTAPHSVYPLVKTPSLKTRGQDSMAAVPALPDSRCARLDGPPQIPSTTNLAHRGAGCPSCAGLIWTCGHLERSAVAAGPARARRGGTGRNGRSEARPSQTALLPVSPRLHRRASGARKVGETSGKRNGEGQPTGISPTGQVWHLDIHYRRSTAQV